MNYPLLLGDKNNKLKQTGATLGSLEEKREWIASGNRGFKKSLAYTGESEKPHTCPGRDNVQRKIKIVSAHLQWSFTPYADRHWRLRQSWLSIGGRPQPTQRAGLQRPGGLICFVSAPGVLETVETTHNKEYSLHKNSLENSLHKTTTHHRQQQQTLGRF